MKPFVKKYGAAFLSGALLAFAFPSWGIFPLAWIALVPLLLQTRNMTPRARAGRFFIAGWTFYSVLLHWLMTNVYWAGGWAFLGYQVLCAILAVYWALTGYLWGRISTRSGAFPTLFILWPVMEMIQARLFSGFGWGEIAYSQGPDLLTAQLASLGDAALISAPIILCNECLTTFLAPILTKAPRMARIRSLRWKFLAIAAIVVTAVHGTGFLLMGEPDYKSKPMNVGIIQTNFPLEMKYDWEYSEEMVRNAAEKSRWLAQHEKVDLFIWPEAMIMNDIDTPMTQQEITRMAQETGVPLFTGASRHNPKTGGEPNSSYLIDKAGKIVDYYDKVHLVAFGEYIPFGKYLPFIQKVVPAIGEAEAGDKQKVFPVAGRCLGPLICFEVLFTDMAENLRRDGADFLSVITNLAWFGMSAAIPQEFELARMRAIETRLPLVHCSNTGVSGVFDPWGRFTLVDAVFGEGGRYGKFTGKFTPEETICQRICGALPTPAPARRPIPGFIAPWAFIIAAAALCLHATIRRFRK
jgi:apolipoprotein N-acyltransferase